MCKNIYWILLTSSISPAGNMPWTATGWNRLSSACYARSKRKQVSRSFNLPTQICRVGLVPVDVVITLYRFWIDHMQRQVFNNHPTERIVSNPLLFSIYSVPLGCPYVLLCRPLQPLSVTAIDWTFMLCTFSFWFEIATSVYGLVALLTGISHIAYVLIANPIHGNHPNR